MSSSSKVFGENDGSKVELPVFVSPTELVFAPNKRRSLMTVFNPYGSETQFRILTTGPDRFDVSITKGVIKPSRRIDITIRLISNRIEELPEPSDELVVIDYFRISLQVGHIRGNKSIKVFWCSSADTSIDGDDSHSPLLAGDDKATKHKIKSLKQHAGSPLQLSSSTPLPSQRNQRLPTLRQGRQTSQLDSPQNGSNVNLVCTICALACVITLFLPLSIDTELCKKAKSFPNQGQVQPTGIIEQLVSLLSISYEMKLGCSFALGLFTYRLISTLPD